MVWTHHPTWYGTSSRCGMDGLIVVRICDGIFSIRLPVEDAVLADYDSQKGFMRLENMLQPRK